MRVKLELCDFKSDFITARWREALPFVENRRGLLIHRPREVTTHKLRKFEAHISVHYWCGNMATGHDNFGFFAEPPKDKLVCAICEARAVMAGEQSSDQIVGRHVHKGRIKAIQTCGCKS